LAAAAAAAGKGDKNLPVYRGIIRRSRRKERKRKKERRDKEKAVSFEAARANKKPKKSWTSPVASAAV